jgi:Domain of unknown function (DUF4266)
MVRVSRSCRAAVAALAAIALGGCAFAPPQPWEKGNLAKPEMTLGGNPLDERFTQHIYGSKENASGGCGCN